MAHIALYMNAIASEKCNGCAREFDSGERMAAVEAEDGTPMGWICDNCVADWRKHGEKSKVVLKLCEL